MVNRYLVGSQWGWEANLKYKVPPFDFSQGRLSTRAFALARWQFCSTSPNYLHVRSIRNFDSSYLRKRIDARGAALYRDVVISQSGIRVTVRITGVRLSPEHLAGSGF